MEGRDGDPAPSFISTLRTAQPTPHKAGVTAGSIFLGNSELSEAFTRYFIVIG